MTEPTRDKIYAHPQTQLGDFVFDAKVVSVFPDMIRRSVPGYAAILNMIEVLTRQHAKPGTNLYDLGCSLGAASLAMQSGLEHADCQLIAVDNAPAMIEQARGVDSEGAIDWRLGDIRDVEIENASVVVLNFTLQFLPKDERARLLARVAVGLNPGGILILSEKIAGNSPQEDQVLVDLHHAFKRANGYSDLEISQKRSALEKVLLPETLGVHQERLHTAGFTRADLWFQCFNFVSILARV